MDFVNELFSFSTTRSGVITPTQQAFLEENLAPLTQSTSSSSLSSQTHQQTQQEPESTGATSSTTASSSKPSKSETPSTTATNTATAALCLSETPAERSDNQAVPVSPPSDIKTSTTTISIQPAETKERSASGSQIVGASSSSTTNKSDGSHTVLSGSQLMEKLTQLADATESYQERRQKFTQDSGGVASEKGGASVAKPASSKGRRRDGDKGRYQTQPITVEEIRAADR